MGNRGSTQLPSPELLQDVSSPDILKQFPPEIWEEVISHVAVDRESLKALTLLSRTITPLVQAVIFRTITLRGRHECEDFLELIASNKALGTFVRTLDIVDSFQAPEMVAWMMMPDSTAGRLAPHFPLVTQLRLCLFRSVIREQDVDEAAVHTKSFFSHFSSVRSLVLEDCRFRNMKEVCDLLGCFRSSLQHLSLKRIARMESPRMTANFPHVGFRNANELERTLIELSAHPLPMLQSLTLERVNVEHVSTWLLRSGIVNGLATMNLRQSNRADIEMASALLGSGCSELECLVLRMEDYQFWSQTPTLIGERTT
jgi:hypothetical protein